MRETRQQPHKQENDGNSSSLEMRKSLLSQVLPVSLDFVLIIYCFAGGSCVGYVELVVFNTA
jgi:hypothetical protein